MAVLKGQTAQESARLRNQSQERAKVLARIQSERKELERALDEEEAMAKELESVIRGLQKKGAGSVGSGPVGGMIWPVRGPITSEFGWRVHPILKTKRYHSGLDIAVPMGTPVAAAASGRVILSGWVGGYGKTVIIDHGGGISSLYGHNSTLLVSVGQDVKAGAIISKAGSTGLSTGPHVHFEVRKNGDVVDPHSWLR
jgi:murein DD-endopeptidase MepM/ murein hydrolase activator NlpD